MKFRLNKSGESTTIFSAILVFVIALVLIIYVMSIPPSDRQNLLNNNAKPNYDVTTGANVPGQSTSEFETDYFFKGPGLVEEVDTDSKKEHSLPAVNLRTKINSIIFIEDPAFFVRESISDSYTRSIPFVIDDLDSISDIYYTFLAKKNVGVLTISLNGNIIYQGDMDSLNFAPRKLSKYMLKKNNVLEFKVNDVGLLFWRTNEYILEDFKLFGNKMETSAQSSFVTFDLGNSEFEFMKTAKLKFYPDCKQQVVNNLEIYINDDLVMDQIPDCGILNIFDIPKGSLNEGYNSLTFSTQKDSYLIDRLQVVTSLKDNDDLIYYFDLEKDIFNVYEDSKEVCGEFDGVCPDGCSEDDDKDCCFVEFSGEGFWCDVLTYNSNDRCVGIVDDANFESCASGYEDESGRPAEEVEDVCGDDTDGVCPAGCSEFYDKDCCMDANKFWCDDLTTIGVAGICMGSVTNAQCAFCPSGYEGDTYDPECEYNSRNILDDDSELKSNYDIKLILRFIDDDKRKRGLIKVNGYETSFSTFDDRIEKNIDRFLEGGTNYVQLLPDNSFHLVSVEISVEED